MKCYELFNDGWSLSYRNQSIDLLCKSMEWFLYDRDICHERVNEKYNESYSASMKKKKKKKKKKKRNKKKKNKKKK